MMANVMSELKHDRPVKVSVHAASQWAGVVGLWSELAAVSPYSSFFLSPEWVESWLETFAASLRPEILVFESDGRPVGICLLVRTVVRVGPFRVTRVYLNTAGENEDDSPCIEFNNILCRQGYEGSVAAALFEHLKSKRWDELAIPGLCEGPVFDALAAVFGDLKQELSWRSSYYVNLAGLRETNTPYDGALSRKWRQHLRQSMKLYAQIGDLQVEQARGVPEALEMLDELSALHQKTWIGRGKPGSYASSLFLDFQRRLITRLVPRQEVQLLRIAAGSETVGFRYNFVQRGKVYCYQSGLSYHEDDRYKPGLVVHGCAIRHYQEQGLDDYDFLAGDAQYKKSLATDSRKLAWVLFRRRNLKFHVIETLRRLKRRSTEKEQPPADADPSPA
jgi:CelD/BcsL family acetyltransferase involved in cellulose biosynthesis